MWPFHYNVQPRKNAWSWCWCSGIEINFWRTNSVQYKKGLDFKEAQEYDKKLQNVTLKFELKAGSNGKVFGGVTPKDISEKLKQEYNIEVDKKNVLTDTIKNEGITTVALKLNEGVSSKVKVQIVAI